MELAFRPIIGAHPPPPGTDEIFIRAGTEHGDRRSLAEFVLEHGIEGLARGEEQPARIVVSVDPTLDDLLAATFVRCLLEDRELPRGAAAFARYAALVREGLVPGEVPLEGTMEGIFLAIRNVGSGDLSDPAVAKRFAADWSRMAEVILTAAAAGKDPFKTPLFGDDLAFARERAFLARDQEVYCQDVLRGQRWLVTLEGGPPDAAGLLLRAPKSLLFKHWSRRATEAGGPYLFLGVTSAAGRWVFSTDPVQRLPIKPLAEALQAAEAACSSERAAADPWFDGAPFGHTLVAAPREGTALAEREVLSIVRRWVRARPLRRSRGGSRALLLCAMVTVLVAGAALAVVLLRRGPAVVDFRSRGAVLQGEAVEELRTEGTGVPGFALIIGVGKSAYGALPAACNDAAAFYRLLRDRYGYRPEHMRLLVDEQQKAVDRDGKTPLRVYGLPTRGEVLRALEELSVETRRYRKGDRTDFIFYYSGHGDTQDRAKTIGYLVLSGYKEQEDTKAADDRGYDMEQLSRDVQKMIRSTHQLLLVDCCFSGFAVVARGVSSASDSKIYKLWKRRAHVIITAGSRDQQTFEEGGHSFFTAALLEALGDEGKPEADAGDGDGVVTDQELGTFLRDRVARRFTPESTRRQTPMYYRGISGDDVGQFLFIPR